MKTIRIFPILAILLFAVSCTQAPQGIKGKNILQVTVLRDGNVPVANLEVDAAEKPGPPPEGGITQTDANGVATFHIKPGTYYIYFNSLNFPNDLEYPQLETVEVQQNRTNKHTIALKTRPMQISEQPDRAVFQKYFSDMGLGRLPAGGKLPLDLQRNVTIFTAGDDLRLYGTVIQEVQISVRYHNVGTGQVIKGADFPPYKPGGFAGGETVTLPSGEYENKVYVNDVLIAVFPFEVR